VKFAGQIADFPAQTAVFLLATGDFHNKQAGNQASKNAG
jgi:hypothetical protein